MIATTVLLPTWAVVERDLLKYFRSRGLLIASLFLPILQLVVIVWSLTTLRL